MFTAQELSPCELAYLNGCPHYKLHSCIKQQTQQQQNETEEKKMPYSATNAKEGIDKTQLPPDSILDGVIFQIEDGTVDKFVKDTTKWQGDTKAPCINVTIDVTSNNGIVKIEQIFTYRVDDKGATLYTPKSNLGKFKAKYKKLPEVGDQVKILVNSEGFGKVKLD